MASASGSFHAANLKNERTAASRALRLRVELFRSFIEVIEKRKHQGGIQVAAANRLEVDRYLSAGRSEFKALRQEWRRNHPAFYQRLAEARHRTQVPGV